MAAGVGIGAMRVRVNRSGLEPVGQDGQANLYRVEDLDRC